MKPRVYKSIALLALCVVAVASQDVVSLKRDLKPGKDVYRIETAIKQVIQMPNGMGEQEMDIKTAMDQSVEIKAVGADGFADVETVAYNIETKMEGPMADMMGGQQAAPKEIKSSYKQDAFGRTKDMKAVGGDPRMAMFNTSSLSGTSVSFPETGVKIGDTWPVPIPKGPMTGDKDQALTAKLVGEKDWEGLKVWVVSMSGPMTMDMDLSSMMGAAGGDNPMAGMKMLMKGTIESTGETYIEKGTGRPVFTTMTAKSAMKMEMPDMGMSLDINGTTATKMALKK